MGARHVCRQEPTTAVLLRKLATAHSQQSTQHSKQQSTESRSYGEEGKGGLLIERLYK